MRAEERAFGMGRRFGVRRGCHTKFQQAPRVLEILYEIRDTGFSVWPTPKNTAPGCCALSLSRQITPSKRLGVRDPSTRPCDARQAQIFTGPLDPPPWTKVDDICPSS